ncbi:MAG TPA: glucosyl-3-phosphoglycerate synthase [Actinomycetota bacterium]|jgi:glucosyl-3-phosphoglycerate synthase|nr:glucosyl-3-phosphoglycerate synthase [Actinomycetota bacterium]
MSVLDPGVMPRPTQVATRWASKRTFSADGVPSLDTLVAGKQLEGSRISVGIATSNDAKTISEICHAIHADLMMAVPFVDELVVLDGQSSDKTTALARAAGATVVDVRRLIPEVPSSSGKGDALWRGLTFLSGDVIVLIDAGIHNFESHVVTRLAAPLLLDRTIRFVKGFHDLPEEFEVEIDSVTHLAGGANLTELLARPLLSIVLPELGGFFQPLAGSYAGRANVFRAMPFLSGCSVDVASLIDAVQVVGLEGTAQAELGVPTNGGRSLDELGSRAHAIARTILRRAAEWKRIKLAPNASTHPLLVPRERDLDPVRIDEIERPPIDVLPPYLAALRAEANGNARDSAVIRFDPRKTKTSTDGDQEAAHHPSTVAGR